MAEKRVKSPTAKQIEQALETMRALGYKIEPPSAELDSAKQEASIVKLGFKGRKAKVIPESTKQLKCNLGFAQTLGGTTYGPGEVVLEANQVSLLRTLVHQDQLTRAQYYDTAQYQPYSRCFIIQPGRSGDSHHRYSKVEVTEAAFNGPAFLSSPTITTGKFDIAGYNPGSTNHPTMEL